MEVLHLFGAAAKAVSNVKKFSDGFKEREMYATRLWDTLQDLGIRLDHLGLVDLDEAADFVYNLDSDTKARRSTVDRMDHGRRTLMDVLLAQSKEVRGQCMAGALFVKAMIANVPDNIRDDGLFRSLSLLAWCQHISGKDLSYFTGGDSRSLAVASFVFDPLWRATGKYANGVDTLFIARHFREAGLRKVFPDMPVYPDWSISRPLRQYCDHKNALELFVKNKHLIESRDRRKKFLQDVHPSLFTSCGEIMGQLQNGERAHDALFLSTSLGKNNCKVIYHPFDVAFMFWIGNSQSLSMVLAKDDIANLESAIPKTSPFWDTIQDWVFVFSSANESLPAPLQTPARPLASLCRLGEYHFYAMDSTEDIISDALLEDPKNLQYQAGDIIVIEDPDFTGIWNPDSEPRSLWFEGKVKGKKMDIYGKALVPIYDHTNPRYHRSTFVGKDKQIVLKTTPGVEDPNDVIPGVFVTYPMGSIMCNIECQTATRWYDPDEEAYFSSEDVVVVDQNTLWREYLDTICKAGPNPWPLDIKLYWD